MQPSGSIEQNVVEMPWRPTYLLKEDHMKHIGPWCELDPGNLSSQNKDVADQWGVPDRSPSEARIGSGHA